MRYYYNLYISEELIEKKEEILYKLEHNMLQWNKYVIVLSPNVNHQLEFYDSCMLRQKYFKKQDPLVVGLADGYDGAMKLVEKMTREVYEETKGADLRTYLQKKQREFEERKE